MKFELEHFLARERQQIDGALAEVARAAAREAPPRLAAALEYALATRGKRLRPILCCAAFRATSGSEPDDAVRRLACALELIHTYSLVHDDLPCMDDDDLRRGRPTVHRVHGVASAIATGAALIPLAAGVAHRAAGSLGLPAAGVAALVGELCRAAGAAGMVGGQWLDLEAERKPPCGDTLACIHGAKTGALLAASLTIGARAGRATPEVRAALGRYGEHLGLAFQIVDDLLDVTADVGALGKHTRKDAARGKATYPGVHGTAGARRLAEDASAAGVAELHRARVRSPELEGLAAYVVRRER